MKSYPIYIIDLKGKVEIVFPEDKKDLTHSEFWEHVVIYKIASCYGLSLSKLKNLPYCQRRARIVGKKIYYGEKISNKLLRQIEKAIGEVELSFVFEEHERRLPFDVAQFKSLIGGSEKSPTS